MSSSDSQLDFEQPNSFCSRTRRSSVFREFLRTPLQTGALFASGAQLANNLVYAANVRNAQSIVEIGAGSGAITDVILSSKSRDSSLLAIEINELLAKILSDRHPGLLVQCGDALKANHYLQQSGFKSCDSVVCSLPWANMSRKSQAEMLCVIEKLLSNGGKFTSFAYAHCRFLPNAKYFKKILEERFENVSMSKVHWANLPPAYIYQAEILA